MPAFRANKKNDEDTSVSADFQHALMQEVMKTELLRIKALIVAATVLVLTLTVAYLVAPDVVKNIWHRQVQRGRALCDLHSVRAV